MNNNSGVFVKLNYKTVGEFKSLIVDREGTFNNSDKYLMCAGKYSKEGWSFVFKANSMAEAEELISRRPTSRPIEIEENYTMNPIHNIDNDIIQIPKWI